MPKKKLDGQEGPTSGDVEIEFKVIGDWLDKQTKEVQDVVKPLIEQEIAGLKSTIATLRDEKKDQGGKLQDALDAVEKGSETEQSLLKLQEDLDNAEAKADFMAEAPQKGCNNPKLAFMVAQADGLFDRKGTPNWEEIKKAAPEVFGKPNTKTNAGDGTKDLPQGTQKSMNNFMRASAGIKAD